ncbi:MAG TPA: amidohydrolase family protein [Terracidiphilus sp.]|nr:amidohydrolase family protein [Terracidiphilus sp.]
MRPRIVSGRDVFTGKPLVVAIEDGRVQAIDEGSGEEPAWIAPGFIDLQVNGYAGCDLNAEILEADTVIALAKRLAATGVTTFLPTLISAPEETMVRALRAIAAARGADSLAAYAIPFVHVEGPSISPEDGPRGAHPREAIRPPSLSEFERWQSVSGGLVGMVTLSPHWENALDFIAALTRKGVLVSIGHTQASAERIHAAAEMGATISTHLGNGIARNLPRHPNPIWAQLADDRLTATFIADGHHLPADTLKSMLRAKTIARSILISDATALAGMAPGSHRAAIGGDVELDTDGRLTMRGTEMLAGAALPLKDGIAWAAASGVCTLADAVRMATENPGRVLGGRGGLRAGAKADLVRFTLDPESKRMTIGTVLIEGVEQE